MQRWFKTSVLPDQYNSGLGWLESEPVLVQCHGNSVALAYCRKYEDSDKVVWLDLGSGSWDLTPLVLYWSELPKLCTPEDVIG